jgi:hypothetical protein
MKKKEKEFETIRDNIMESVLFQNHESKRDSEERHLKIIQNIQQTQNEIQMQYQNEMQQWSDKNDIQEEALQTLKEGLLENNVLFTSSSERVEQQIKEIHEMIRELTYRVNLVGDMQQYNTRSEMVSYRMMFLHPFAEDPAYDSFRNKIRKYSSIEYVYELFDQQHDNYPCGKLSKET